MSYIAESVCSKGVVPIEVWVAPMCAQLPDVMGNHAYKMSHLLRKHTSVIVSSKLAGFSPP